MPSALKPTLRDTLVPSSRAQRCPSPHTPWPLRRLQCGGDSRCADVWLAPRTLAQPRATHVWFPEPLGAQADSTAPSHASQGVSEDEDTSRTRHVPVVAPDKSGFSAPQNPGGACCPRATASVTSAHQGGRGSGLVCP